MLALEKMTWSRQKGASTPCSRCGSTDRYPRGKSGGGGGCVPCTKRTANEWHRAKKASPDAEEYQRNKTFKARLNKYKIDEALLASMVEKQSGLCAICRSERATHIDHDHATDRVRGLLCLGCNAGIGQLRESIAILEAAIRYLLS
jgi:hypothetical protein